MGENRGGGDGQRCLVSRDLVNGALWKAISVSQAPSSFAYTGSTLSINTPYSVTSLIPGTGHPVGDPTLDMSEGD